MEFRLDEDSLGKVRVRADAYYGPFTTRALEQYKVTGRPAHPDLIRAFVMIKRSAAVTNVDVGVLDDERGRHIVSACDSILSGKLVEWFAVDMINSGAGTAFNMNTNEVIANAALVSMGRSLGEYSHIHPNDHVNMSQSSNDTYPTAMHMAVLFGMERVVPAVDSLAESLGRKAQEFGQFRKIGRTHLMDALPVTLGSEFAAYRTAVSKCSALLKSSLAGLYPVALGGTAVGSGANAPAGYRETAVSELASISGLPLVPESDMQHGLQSRFAVAAVSAAVRSLAVELNKVSNDIRLMASGPVAGLSEVGIPAVHAGSSIMPGKVNPSLAECMNMVCYNIMGNDTAVALAAQAGQFELNVMLPGMLKCMLESTDMMAGFLPVFCSNLIDGLTANVERMRDVMSRSPVIVTLLAPKIGYQRSAQLYKESLSSGRSIRDLAVSSGLTADEVDSLLS